jgi:non-lysosomal glucosylceramidase
MASDSGSKRRTFLKQAALGVAAGSAAGQAPPAVPGAAAPTRAAAAARIAFPRVFTGRQLAMIAFPLGGVGAGSISLGGRGQLRDWEMINRSDKGNAPSYAFPAVWARSGERAAVARVLEARYLPPYEGSSGLGTRSAPGLSRLASAKFTGAYPLARIDFEDPDLPVRIALEAFSPFIPLDADASGLPVAVLRYHVKNPGRAPARVSIAWSVENPVQAARRGERDTRRNEYRAAPPLRGLLMTNPGLAKDDVFWGSFALAYLGGEETEVTHLSGWPKGRWWNSPLLFWDDFTADGVLGPEPTEPGAVAALCATRTVAPGAEAEFPFLLAWHFPNRTPERCGWHAPKGHEKDVIGNWYATRFADAWAAADFAARNVKTLEQRTRVFAAAFRESSLPPEIKDAASANLSTLAATTCFRTADGEFHGFEGVNDHGGCCHGNCTHVWNYETATAHVFPSLARSLRKAAFGYSMDENGAMHFRQSLPDGYDRSGFAAADGQMGQILHAYLDWTLSGDRAWLAEMWPKIRKAIAFAWVKGGWDADRDGVMEGVQHNTYDVEFYGPNPLCGIYYLAALRACEEMAREVGDNGNAAEYRRLFESGRAWIDKNLFNGDYYVQQIQPRRKEEIAPVLVSSMGADDPQHPEYQMGDGCLADQLLGQLLADACGLGPVVDEAHARRALASIWRYNHKNSMARHDNVERTYVLNDEAAIIVCDYGKGARPRIPFPYFAEAWTGLEYVAASGMLYAGMLREGRQGFAQARARYDGERRNPWDEAECGHHYARAMSSWSGVLALSGFRYHGGQRKVTVLPPAPGARFQCFWMCGTGWGGFTREESAGLGRLTLSVNEGKIALRAVEWAAAGAKATARLGVSALRPSFRREGERVLIEFPESFEVNPGKELVIEVRAA